MSPKRHNSQTNWEAFRTQIKDSLRLLPVMSKHLRKAMLKILHLIPEENRNISDLGFDRNTLS
jgi:hypothetical protein